jgi:hypothetical protein
MEPGAASEFERSLNECRAHVVLSNQYAQLVGLMGSAAPPAEPPSGHKERFMARLATTPQPEIAEPTPPRLTVVPTAPSAPEAAAPAPAPTTGASAGGAPVTDLGEYRERKRAGLSWPAIAAIAAALVLLVGGIAWFSNYNQGIRIPEGAIVFPVQGTDVQKDAVALGVIDPTTNQAYLVTNGLQPLTPEQVYEMWWLLPNNQGVVSAGTFTVDASGKGTHKTTAPGPVSTYAGLAVSLESTPAPTDAPAGPVVMAGMYTIP